MFSLSDWWTIDQVRKDFNTINNISNSSLTDVYKSVYYRYYLPVDRVQISLQVVGSHQSEFRATGVTVAAFQLILADFSP